MTILITDPDNDPIPEDLREYTLGDYIGEATELLPPNPELADDNLLYGN